jgi:hypothetical protein
MFVSTGGDSMTPGSSRGTPYNLPMVSPVDLASLSSLLYGSLLQESNSEIRFSHIAIQALVKCSHNSNLQKNSERNAGKY